MKVFYESTPTQVAFSLGRVVLNQFALSPASGEKGYVGAGRGMMGEIHVRIYIVGTSSRETRFFCGFRRIGSLSPGYAVAVDDEVRKMLGLVLWFREWQQVPHILQVFRPKGRRYSKARFEFEVELSI